MNNNDRKHFQNSRKIKNIEKMIKELQDQRKSKNQNVQSGVGYYQTCDNHNHYSPEHICHNRNFEIMRQKQQQNDHNLFLSEHQEVDFNLFTQTMQNITNLIETNQLKVQSLQRKNQFLMKHMDNLKKIFIKSYQTYNDTMNHYDEAQSSKLSVPNRQSYFDGLVSKPLPKDLDDDYQSSVNEIKSQNNTLTSKKPKKSQQHSNISKKSSKYYIDTIWHNEQQSIKTFLQSWLKKNVVQTLSSSGKIIQKRTILLLYLKWKELQNLGKNNESELSQAQIQQILTIQMRTAFNCTCTTRGYEGISFIKKPQNNSTTIEAQKQVKSIPQKKNQIQQIEQPVHKINENIEEEFSFDMLSEEGQIKKDQCYFDEENQN